MMKSIGMSFKEQPKRFAFKNECLFLQYPELKRSSSFTGERGVGVMGTGLLRIQSFLYNALLIESVQALVDTMQEFETQLQNHFKTQPW
jgi:phosphoserine aminotransferase